MTPRANATDFQTLMQAEPPDFAIGMTQEEVDERLDALGWELVLEEVARGNLPNKLALRYRTPIIKFRRWLDMRIAQAELALNDATGRSYEPLLNEAMRLCAESLVVKSEMTLMQDVSDAQQAGMLKAFSKRIAEMADAMQPEVWGGRDPLRTAAVNALNIGAGGAGGTQIQINIGNAALKGTEYEHDGVLIPGTEVFNAPLPALTQP